MGRDSEWDGDRLFVKAYHELLLDSRLRNGDSEVWLLMYYSAGREKRECYATVATLCKLSGLSKNALIPARKRLLKAGWCRAKGRWNESKVFTILISQDAAQFSRKGNTGTNEIPESGKVSGTERESNKRDLYKKIIETLIRKVPFRGIVVGSKFIEPKTFKALYRSLLPWFLEKFDTEAQAEEWGEDWIKYYKMPADPLNGKYDDRAISLVAFALKPLHYTNSIDAYIMRQKPGRTMVLRKPEDIGMR